MHGGEHTTSTSPGKHARAYDNGLSAGRNNTSKHIVVSRSKSAAHNTAFIEAANPDCRLCVESSLRKSEMKPTLYNKNTMIQSKTLLTGLLMGMILIGALTLPGSKGVNSQLNDAMVFANAVRAKVREMEKSLHSSIPITVTGHSLGGTLAEIEAFRFGFHGVTFNAYGAAGLAYNVPEGGHQIINYMRATDIVSSASPHFGETHIVAAPEDIDALRKGGYLDPADPKQPPNPFVTTSVAAHKMGNFLPHNEIVGESLLSPLAEARYRAHHASIDRFRQDVGLDRKVLSGEWALQGELSPAQVSAREDLMKAQAASLAAGAVVHSPLAAIAAIDSVGKAIADPIRQAAGDVNAGLDRMSRAMGSDTVERVGKQAAQDLSQGASHAFDALNNRVSNLMNEVDRMVHKPLGASAPHMKPAPRSSRPLQLDNTAHPDHAMYLQARTGVHKLDAEQQRTSDQRSDQLAAALVVAAVQKGLDSIDKVQLTIDADHVFASQSNKLLWGPSMAGVPTVQALNTPIEQSSKAWEQAMQGKTQEAAAQQKVQKIQQPPMPQHSHGMSR